MSAKTELLDRIKYLNVALNSVSVIDSGIGLNDHNGAAKLLRKGLGIVAFNILEDFIKARSLEALDAISNSGIRYSDLSDKLQEATTLGALKALAFRAKIAKKDGGNWMSMIHDETGNINSTSTRNFTLSKYSFAYENSNIGANEITEMLRAFNITGGWDKLRSISNAIFGGVANLSESYKNAAERRHNAAHVAQFEYEYSWLQNIEAEILAIAASLDIVLSALCRVIDAQPQKKLSEHNLDAQLKYRYLCEESGLYKEKKNPNSRTIKNWNDLNNAVQTLQPTLTSRNEFLIVLNRAGRVTNWYC